ncbi:hypothetical protein RHGRI_030142 [Rhododendron griersonianum]|uniref:Uncharacterized protein n=1 Tax=Rhododendron griersonianum TaxID=479676 RepID=A0AAV6IQ17_9ERIC|nr:hypothetical protein RHGRI_030142 [Rhododendron griersonianum]
MNQPLVWKFTLWTSSQTVGRSDFIAGIPQGKKNSVVLGSLPEHRCWYHVFF